MQCSNVAGSYRGEQRIWTVEGGRANICFVEASDALGIENLGRSQHDGGVEQVAGKGGVVGYFNKLSGFGTENCDRSQHEGVVEQVAGMCTAVECRFRIVTVGVEDVPNALHEQYFKPLANHRI